MGSFIFTLKSNSFARHKKAREMRRQHRVQSETGTIGQNAAQLTKASLDSYTLAIHTHHFKSEAVMCLTVSN